MDNTNFNQDFRAFAVAALKISGSMLDSLAPEVQHGIEAALHGGARLELSFGPLPAFKTVRLGLVEAEGRRHTICTAQVQGAPELLLEPQVRPGAGHGRVGGQAAAGARRSAWC